MKLSSNHKKRLKQLSDLRYRTKHPERKKHVWLRLRYGIGIDDYNILLVKQQSLCAICRKPEKNGKSLSVDHNHTTGKVRGLLCDDCNRALGLFYESAEVLQNAIMYIRLTN